MDRKILVVDDDEKIQELLRDAFADAGFQVVPALSAEEAVTILDREWFPIYFIDMQLPGANGLELCRTIRKRNPTVTLFAMSGYSGHYHLIDALDAGFNDYFAKPFSVPVLVKNVLDAFEKMDRWHSHQRQ
ncbi:MAG: response regulator [bacterium]|nr:response regulator [bacterium]